MKPMVPIIGTIGNKSFVIGNLKIEWAPGSG
jgi:hypothetical protein